MTSLEEGENPQSMNDPSPNTDTSALQGAQGLLAGMTLLNELEPDVDDETLESDVPVNQTTPFLDSKWINILEAFVRMGFQVQINTQNQAWKPKWEHEREQEQEREREREREREKEKFERIHDYISRIPQWIALRLLRKEFNSLHRQFLRLPARNRSHLKKFRNRCNGPAELLNTGILTSKDILLGSTPVSLKEVFSFIMLSYAMAATRNPDRSVLFSPTRLEFSIWRQSISNEAERETFDELVSLMWPEVDSQVNDVMELSEEKEKSDRDNDSWKDFSWFNNLPHHSMVSPETVQASMHDTVSSIYDHHPGDDFDFSLFLNMEMLDDLSTTVEPPSQTLSSAVAAEEMRGVIIPPTDEKVNTPKLTPVRGLLVQTIFFLQFLGFVTYLINLGVLFVYLSGVDRCCLPKLIECSTTATSSFIRYVDIAKYRILSPLRLNPKFSNLGPLLVVPVKLLETGWIWSLRDLEEYMISMARRFSRSPEVFQSFTTEILKGCLTAASEIDYEYIYREDHDDADDYSMEYIKIRQEKEVASFVASEGTTSNATPVHVADASISDSVAAELLAPVSRKRASAESFEPATKHVRRASPTQTFQAPNISSDEEDNLAPESVGNHSTETIQPSTCNFPGCKKAYSGWDGANNLRRHKKEKHEGSSSWPCSFGGCPIVSTRLHNLRQHWIKSHGPTPLPTWLFPTRSKGGGGVSRKKVDPADGDKSAEL